jgi:hypothetical protein
LGPGEEFLRSRDILGNRLLGQYMLAGGEGLLDIVRLGEDGQTVLC